MSVSISRSIGPVTALDSATTGKSRIVAYDGNVNALVVYVTGVGTISTGTLLIEECYESAVGAFTGTWSQVTSIDLTTLTGGGTSGKQVAAHYLGCFWHVRARISVDVTGSGGAVTVVLLGA